MTPKAALVALAILASLALAVVFTQTGPAEAGRGKGAVARAGDAVASGANARAVGGETTQGDEGGKDERSATPADGKAVLRMGGDDGVGFSGTCSVGGEEKKFKGKVPGEFSFDLNGGDLECEVRKEGGDGTLRIALTAGNDRVVQEASGDGAIKLGYSGNGTSSSTSSTSSVSGSSGVVSQSSSVSSSSVVRSSSSSSSR